MRSSGLCWHLSYRHLGYSRFLVFLVGCCYIIDLRVKLMGFGSVYYPRNLSSIIIIKDTLQIQ